MPSIAGPSAVLLGESTVAVAGSGRASAACIWKALPEKLVERSLKAVRWVAPNGLYALGLGPGAA
jgi:hypothetical protein